MRIKYRVAFILYILLSINDAVAQLCQGSLGDPIVNITFASGNNPGPSLSAATTSYVYAAADCPDDGFYAVRNNSNSCFGSTWHSIVKDHTGNANGYFMLVNASLQPSAFYVDTVRGLCSNTTFEFAAWIANVLKLSSCGGNGIQPNLTFTIAKTDGTILQTYNTGFIAGDATAQWRQYGFFFTTPAGVSDVVLRIFNNSQGGCGNDLALDDITFRPCGPLITASVDGFTTDSVFYCETGATSFTLRTAISNGFANPVYQWQQRTDNINWTDIAGATAATYTVNFAANATGKNKYRMTTAEQSNFSSAQCRIVSPVITIVKGTTPVTTMTITSPACQGSPVTFTATGGTTYVWYRDGGGLGNTNATFTLPGIDTNLAGKIYVSSQSLTGCAKLDSAILVVLPKPTAMVGFDTAAICNGRSIQLNASGGITYLWLPASSLSADDIPNPVATPAATTNYVLTVTGTNGCPDTDTSTVNVVDSIVADAGADKTIIKGDAVQLNNTTAPGTYLWSPADYLSNPSAKAPVATPPQDIEYVLTATSLAGCNTDMDTVYIRVFNDIYVPNSFSPNGNGINDTWNIPALIAFPQFELNVYNRAGNIVYQRKNIFIPWDGYFKGVPLDTGNYVYFIKLNNSNKRMMKGNVMLIR